MRDIRVAAVQFQHAPGDKTYNLGRVRHYLTEAAKARVEIIAFPEMCITGYWHTRKLSHDAMEALAEPVPDGPSTQELRRLSAQHGMTIGAGLIERAADGRLYNGYVVAMGCYAQIAPDEVGAVDAVDLVIKANKERLLEQLESFGLQLGDPDAAFGPSPAGPDNLVPLPPSRVRQFVKIQDGCDDYCTYCIVPFARGHSLSRPAAAVVAEVQELVARGCREIVLTGVQIGAYGRDRYATAADELPPAGAPLAALVGRLLVETNVDRIRISSIQPQDWPKSFLELFQDPRLCHHLHLPLQSGSDAVLLTFEQSTAVVERVLATVGAAARPPRLIVHAAPRIAEPQLLYPHLRAVD